MKKEKQNNKTSKKLSKKIIIFIVVVILIIIGAVAFFLLKSDNENNEDNIATQSVKIFTESMNLFQNRYSGMVVAEDTIKLKKDSQQKVKELYVEKGQTVQKGQKLFEYDTSENQAKVEQAKLEIEKMQNSITNDKKQIQNLLEQATANPNDQAISIEIQGLDNEVKQTEYNIKTKNLEIDTLNKSIKNAVVTAEIDGVIQSINDGEIDTTSGYSDETDDAYITIMKTGDYRIKGVVNEQNVMMFTEGQKVIVRSRIDENKTWKGTISKVDTANPENNENNVSMMYGNSDTMTTSSKYPFYIDLENKDGLMMGQHVYIEFDNGQMTEKEGIWIPSYFVVEENGENYIWVAGKNDKLEKRKIKVGAKDDNLLETQITEGLSEDDYITEPKEDLIEGLKVSKYDNPEDIPFDEPENMENFQNGESIIEDGAVMEDMTGGEIIDGQTTMQEGIIPQDVTSTDTSAQPAGGQQ